ncbi:hypothetical protein Ahy_A06g026735 isoform A [Arachis hypogaea]|uniref:Uncharacterized protein n=1 Tax=Arachis hypogaea TaxID=3818 RepID=A0A445CLF5_ARAHY|nr:hypothetical protein Ahy_A06g026735 isoform A [Arachis hypogaea]
MAPATVEKSFAMETGGEPSDCTSTAESLRPPTYDVVRTSPAAEQKRGTDLTSIERNDQLKDDERDEVGKDWETLIRATPVVRADFCGKTRELIALGCLEEIFNSAHRVGCDEATSASLDSRVRFDFSSSCEDVLQKILDEKWMELSF